MAAELQPGPSGGQPPVNFHGAPIGPTFDVVDLLPSSAAERLRALRLRAKESHLLVPPHEELREASLARTNAANSLQRLQAHPQDGGFNLKPDHRSVIEAERTLDKASAAFTRLTELQQVRTAAWQAATGALANVEAWLKNGRPGGTTLEAVEVDPPRPVKGEAGVLDQIENRRRRVRELKAQKHTIESAPHPSAWAKQKVRADIAALASRGAIDPSEVIEHGGELVWPMSRLSSEVHSAQERGLAFAQVPDVLALFAWLHHHALLAAIDKEIAATADDKAALSHTDRELRLAEVLADMLATEREESALVWRAMDEKLPVEFRADINPVAILQVQLITTATPNGHQEPTSPMHAWDFVFGGRRR